MHHVTLNNRLLSFRNVYDETVRERKQADIYSEAETDIRVVIRKMESGEAGDETIYLSADPDLAWKTFVSQFTLSEAAGGLVRNENDDFLVIFRRGKWDLPKGKIDYDEDPEQAALREVQEETGAVTLEVIRPLSDTFHVYRQDGNNFLKKTNWFLMDGSIDDELVAQSEEDITRVEWMSRERIFSEMFANTYLNVKILLQEYFK